VCPRPDGRVHVERVVRDERAEIAARVRDEPDLEVVVPKRGERWQRVLVELEVLGVFPCTRHLHGALVRALRVAAHPADDPLGEEHPDLLVVVELRMPLDHLDRVSARVRVARGVEVEPEPPAERLVALRPEVGARLGEREVDVEEDGAQFHAAASSSQRAVSACSAW
jgi:hypothetical protein